MTLVIYFVNEYNLILKISKLLNDSGYLVKYDEGSGVGKKRLQHIKTIISDSKACICLLTESYVNVQSCRKELDGILDYLLTKNIIIVYIGNKQNILAAYSLGMRTLLEGMKGIELRDETDPKVVQEQLLAMIEDGKIERPIVQFGRYIQTPRSKSIFVRQDKIDPIDWIVLDKCGNELLLISKYALDCQPYDTGGKEITWETCMLRRWLNKEFYEAAFSEEERMRIRETRNENKDNPKYGTKGGNPTRDKVFLLSIEEAEEYFGSDGERRCYLTAYAKKHGAWSSSEGYCWWWLRSPGNESSPAARVSTAGSLHFNGFWVSTSNSAVRPSLRLHL